MPARILAVLARLIAVGAVAAALVAAGPAAAADNPVDANGKKSCEVYSGTGTVLWVPHGTVLTTQDGQKFTCVNGQWVKDAATRPVAGTWSVRSAQYGLVTLQVQVTKA